eukprot:126473_1
MANLRTNLDIYCKIIPETLEARASAHNNLKHLNCTLNEEKLENFTQNVRWPYYNVIIHLMGMEKELSRLQEFDHTLTLSFLHQTMLVGRYFRHLETDCVCPVGIVNICVLFLRDIDNRMIDAFRTTLSTMTEQHTLSVITLAPIKMDTKALRKYKRFMQKFIKYTVYDEIWIPRLLTSRVSKGSMIWNELKMNLLARNST